MLFNLPHAFSSHNDNPPTLAPGGTTCPCFPPPRPFLIPKPLTPSCTVPHLQWCVNKHFCVHSSKGTACGSSAPEPCMGAGSHQQRQRLRQVTAERCCCCGAAAEQLLCRCCLCGCSWQELCGDAVLDLGQEVREETLQDAQGSRSAGSQHNSAARRGRRRSAVVGQQKFVHRVCGRSLITMLVWEWSISKRLSSGHIMHTA
jgi:hypothetical protein